MKNIILLVCTVTVLSACNGANEKIKERIAGSDSMAINYFKGDGSEDTVVAVKIIRDKNTIAQMAGFISAKKTTNDFKCGYDGSLHFFKMNQVVQDINFRMNEEGCMHFSFLQDGIYQATALSEPAKKLITALRK